MARIENHKYSIEEAFRECFYIVPDYQREYVWTDKEVHQLLEDIGEQIDAGTTREYFIGTVLVSPRASTTSGRNMATARAASGDSACTSSSKYLPCRTSATAS